MAESPHTMSELWGRIGELEQALLRERRLVASARQQHDEAIREAQSRPTQRQLQDAQEEIARLERRLAEVYGSRTWRAGRVLWRLFHLPGSIRPSRSPAAPREPGGDPIAEPAQSAPARINYSLVENTVVRDKYEKALTRRAFSIAGSGRNVVMAVYTTDLDEGRGDLYTAIGLGRHLEKIGYEVIYLPRDRWYDVPVDTDLFVALLETVDLSLVPDQVTTIAWVRNQTEVWAREPWLPWYDHVLCSSARSCEVLAEVCPGPISLLPIGFDPELFYSFGRVEDREGIVSTVNQWGRERELFTSLEELSIDFPLALFGEQRGTSESLASHARGPVPFFALPSLYNEAAIVLDDFNHTTAGYGNVNSRVFEAAACGAIVISNRPVDETGPADIAAYGSSAELGELIEASLDSAEAAKHAEERSQRVLERHSYAVRAEQFRGAIEKPTVSQSRRMRSGASPANTDSPYMEMMWAGLRNQGAVPLLVSQQRDFDALAAAAEQRPALFHLNWTAPVLGSAGDDRARRERYRWFLSSVDRLVELGVPSIWTLHNVLPHECADLRLEAQLRQELADRVDIVHVMCETSATHCAGVFSIPQSKIRVIPHPSYVDVYPNVVDKQTARHELGLEYDDFVYLYFGQVRPYKGVDLLLDAFDRLAPQEPTARLLIAGKAGRFAEMDEIKQRARAHPQVGGFFGEIPDADVQLYMNAADVVVLPYRDALNSGTLQLAYSFGRPVVAAAVGCIPDQVDTTTGLTFDPAGGVTALLAGMQEARGLTGDHGVAAYARAAEVHYLDISIRFASLVDELLAQRAGDTKR